MEWLCWVFGALVLITLLGHGMWVAVATIFRSAKPKVPPHATAAGAKADLSAMEIQLRRLLESGLIDVVTYGRVMSALAVVRTREKPAAAPPPLPVLPLIPHDPVSEVRELAIDQSPAAPLLAIPEATPSAQGVVRPKPAKPPRAARAPRRPFSQVFAAFLRESNIRWGELVGGLLIVGCSVALVISFWGQIAAKPFFQFGLFTGITTATLALGLYAEHRWKLPTTSRGILLIATMLVPLNFLALAALSHGARASAFVSVGEVAALALFGFLVWHAARVLAPYWPHLLTLGVTVLSAALLITQHFTNAQSAGRPLALGVLPVAVYGGIIAAMLRRAGRWKQIRAHGAEAIFLVLGVLSFATALDFGLLILPSAHPFRVAHDLSPLLSLAAAPAMACGLLLWRRIKDKRASRARTAGTAIAVGATFLMLGCLALAWPDPRTLLPLALLDLIAFTLIAIVFDIPIAHAPAAPCVGIVYVLAIEMLSGHVGWVSASAELTHALTDACTGLWLLPLFAILVAIAWLVARVGHRVEATVYGCAAIAVAAINILVTAWLGFGRPGDPHTATWVFLAYSATALLAARHLRRQAAGWAGCALLAAAFVQFFLTRTSVAMTWPTALLAYASVALAGAILRRRDVDSSAALLVPVRWTALAATGLATVLLLGNLSLARLNPIAVRVAWISGLCLIASANELLEPLFVAGQIVMALAAALAVLARLSIRPWFAASSEPLLDPWTLQAIGTALAVVALVFSIGRRFLPDRSAVTRWLDRQFAFDRVLSLFVAAGFAALAVGAFAPGLGIEFASGGMPPAIDAWSVHAAGGGSWLVLAVLVPTLILWLSGRWIRVAIPILLTLLAFAGLLWAAGWSQKHAAASAARWALAAVLLLGSSALWMRRRLPQAFEPVADECRLLLTVLAALPIIAISFYATGLLVYSSVLPKPDASCFFGRIGSQTSYLTPLAIVAIVFILNAVRERSSSWALSASAVCNLAVTLAYAFHLAATYRPLAGDQVLRLIQINVIALALFALAWQAARRFAAEMSPSALLWIQLSVAMLGNALLLALAAFWIIVWPDWSAHPLAVIGGPVGWIAFAITAAAFFQARASQTDRFTPAATTLTVLCAGILCASLASGRNVAGWTGYHTLMAAAVLASGANLAAGAWTARRRRGWAEPAPIAQPIIPAVAAPVELQYARHDQAGGPQSAAIYVGGQLLQPAILRWTGIANALAVLLSFRAMAGDPQRPWWSAGITALIALLWATLACWLLAPRLLYAGGLLLNLAATFWFIDRLAPNGASLLDLGLANIAVLSVSGLAALVLHVNVFRRPAEGPTRTPRLPFHRFASEASMIGLVPIMCLLVTSDAGGHFLYASTLLTWAAIGPSLVLALAMLWDAQAPYALAEAYALGLIALAAGLHQTHYLNQPIEAAGAVALSIYVLVTGLAYAAGDAIAQLASGLGMPSVRRDETSGWLTPASIVLVAIALALAIGSDFALGRLPLRLAPATAVYLAMLGLFFLSRRDRRMDLRYVILGLLPIDGVAWAWAWVPPAGGDTLLRAVLLLLVLAASLILIGWMAMGRTDGALWPAAARRAVGPIAGAWAAGLLAVLGIEVATAFGGGPVSLVVWAVAVVLLNVIAGAAACVLIALVPILDPLKLSVERRGVYVYVAETMLALGFVHLRLTMPWLFGGVLAQYWPLLVMALAFGGVALGELFRRKGTVALSSPVFRTGAFLPLLPVIAFWAAPSRVDLSTLLFAVGVFYAILSATRRSFAFGVLAALAANGGLWALLAGQPGLAFLVHPQIWLIPAAASVLIAAQLNRDRLSPVQLRFVRYCCLMIVYVSSTADIFLNGVKDHPWLPLVLAGLSVGGVMLGILFRLRAFLFLGTAFLGLSILTMIYYASADLHWTWLWYVAGIGLGASILVLFALFEKKRAEMLALVDGLKSWE